MINAAFGPPHHPVFWRNQDSSLKKMTCGLRIVLNPTSDSINPQETISEAIAETGADGPGLSCPGLIKSAV
jgi:hypothetical protein